MIGRVDASGSLVAAASVAAAMLVLLGAPRRRVHRSDQLPTRRSVTRRRRRRTSSLAPDPVAAWAADLARALRSGATLHHALVHTVPGDVALAERVDPLRARLDRGEGLLDALGTWSATTGSHLDMVAAVLWACGSAGGPAAEPLDRAAAALRARAADLADRATHSAQARASARVMTLLPVVALVVLGLTDDGVRSFLASPLGVTCVALGAALNLAGWWWMHRVIEATRWA